MHWCLCQALAFLQVTMWSPWASIGALKPRGGMPRCHFNSIWNVLESNANPKVADGRATCQPENNGPSWCASRTAYRSGIVRSKPVQRPCDTCVCHHACEGCVAMPSVGTPAAVQVFRGSISGPMRPVKDCSRSGISGGMWDAAQEMLRSMGAERYQVRMADRRAGPATSDGMRIPRLPF